MIEQDRVREHTPAALQERIDQRTKDYVRLYASQPFEQISARIDELDREWDIERAVEFQGSITALLGIVLAFTHNRKWLWLTVINQSFLLQHSIQGWCPPVSLWRRFGVRTRKEIDIERTALKALRGDFEALTDMASSDSAPDLAVEVAAQH